MKIIYGLHFFSYPTILIIASNKSQPDQYFLFLIAIFENFEIFYVVPRSGCEVAVLPIIFQKLHENSSKQKKEFFHDLAALKSCLPLPLLNVMLIIVSM